MMVRYKEDGSMEFWTRRKTIIEEPLPDLRRALAGLKVPPDSILDGELLHHRGKTKQTLVLFGMYRWDGQWLSNDTQREIIKRTDALVPDSGLITKPKRAIYDKKRFYWEALAEDVENEGIVVKRLDSTPEFSFTRCEVVRSWLKVKPVP